MNLIPVTSAHGGGVMLVNFDHVYLVASHDDRNESAGCVINFTNADRYRVEVKESRTELLRLLEKPSSK